MTTINRTSLPTVVKVNKKEYVVNIELSHKHQDKQPFDTKGCILVKVLSRRLKGKLDLHHKPYQPTEWIYSKKQ